MASEHYFDPAPVKVRGRTYMIFRRTAHADGSFYCRLQIGGKRTLRSLGTCQLPLAKTRAALFIKAALDERWDDVERIFAKSRDGAAPTPDVCTIGEIFAAYRSGEEVVRPQTAQRNLITMRVILRTVLGVEKPEEVSTAELTEGLAKAYQAKVQGRDHPSYQAVLRQNITANSILRQARSLFSARARKKYAHLNLPDLTGFMKVPSLKEPSQRYADNPIPQTVIDKINAALPKLKKQDERLWVIHLMIRLMGMRDSEIIRAHRGWLVEKPTVAGPRWFLNIILQDGEDAPKRSEGEIPVPAELLEFFFRQEDFLIPAKTYTERKELVERVHSRWLRQFIPDRTKTNHELRKHAGSVVATKTNSFEQAARFLRIDIETAKNHYLALLKPMDALSAADLGM